MAVFAPSPIVTVTIEHGGPGPPEIHFHAGGQGVWVARMAHALGAQVGLSAVLGGESGQILGTVLQAHGLNVRAVHGSLEKGVYVHDRRNGSRVPIAEVPAPRLDVTSSTSSTAWALTDALGSQVACLTGPQHAGGLEPSVYRRLAGDLRRNHVTVVAELTGPALPAALSAGVDVLKLSDTELDAEGWAKDTSAVSLIDARTRLRAAGARAIVASRGPEPAIALADDVFFKLGGPRVTPADPTGTGDTMVAAIAVGLARWSQPARCDGVRCRHGRDQVCMRRSSASRTPRAGGTSWSIPVTEAGAATKRPADPAVGLFVRQTTAKYGKPWMPPSAARSTKSPAYRPESVATPHD